MKKLRFVSASPLYASQFVNQNMWKVMKRDLGLVGPQFPTSHPHLKLTYLCSQSLSNDAHL
jgi:hypothetical protein